MPHSRQAPADTPSSTGTRCADGRPTRAPRTARPLDPYAEGSEPDPRFSLANERTFLAWQRTALALMAGGVGVEALTEHTAGRDLLAVALILLGICCAVTAQFRWASVERAMRTSRPLPRLRGGRLLPVALAVLGVAFAAMILVR
ncbi:YidH family protein [Streptomyces sp. NPDC004111]|uniref:YidH family protein n=1 Tax=Streptomyces sp. NPDC004111 TaxID=3364690 RepID=UPI00368E4D0D